MLPRTRVPLMRPAHRQRSIPLPVLLATVMVMPVLLWFVFKAPVKQPPAAPSTLLDKLKEQGLAGAHQQQAAGAKSAAATAAAGTPASQAAAAAAAAGGSGNFTWVTADRIAAAAKYRQEVLLQPKPRPAAAAGSYVIDPEPHDMKAQHKKVAVYVSSAEFKAKVAARQSAGRRGIIINAGGPHLITSTVVTLKVLREVLNCTLPIELVWHSAIEMDNTTLAALQQRWGPITGINLSSMPWPAHQRPKPQLGQPGWNQTKFLGKVMSLTVSSFASALLLDADSLPLANPESLWSDVSYQLAGNLLWPDFWTPHSTEHQDVVYDMVGLKHKEAEALIAAGKGRLSQRDTESGQLLLDLVRHADVAEWALWVNTFGDDIYKAVWGDKDTWSLAFGVAGKAHAFNQLQVPPGAALTWQPDKLLVKVTNAKQAGWELAGMLQFNGAGQPAFLHRTMNKFSWGGQPWHIGLLTGPLPLRWIRYYLSQDAQGPTVGVPYDYVAPAGAFVPWSIPKPLNTSLPVQDGWMATAEEVCPAATFIMYWRLREHAIPTGYNSTLDAACELLLNLLLGPDTEPYASAGLTKAPELLAVGSNVDFDHVVTKRNNPNPLIPAEEVPDGTPVMAWVPDYMTPVVPTVVSRALAGSYEAFEWLKQHVEAFPIVKGTNSSSGSAVTAGG